MAGKVVPEMYFDGVGSVSFLGGVIRAEMVGYSQVNKDANGNPLFEPKQELILSPQGFIQITNAFNALLKKLNDSGVLRTEPRAPESAKEKPEKGERGKK